MIIFPRKDYVSIQNDIFMLSLDDYSPHGVLGGVSEEADLNAWQYTVDIIYRCLVAGLWKVWNIEWMEANEIQNYASLCEKLSELNPFELSDEGERYWLEPLICSTDISVRMLNRFGIKDFSETFSESFIEAIEEKFSENNVSLELDIIFPIKEKA